MTEMRALTMGRWADGPMGVRARADFYVKDWIHDDFFVIVSNKNVHCGNYGDWHSESTQNSPIFQDNHIIFYYYVAADVQAWPKSAAFWDGEGVEVGEGLCPYEIKRVPRSISFAVGKSSPDSAPRTQRIER
jgi:hypothetical protein